MYVHSLISSLIPLFNKEINKKKINKGKIIHSPFPLLTVEDEAKELKAEAERADKPGKEVTDEPVVVEGEAVVEAFVTRPL